MNRWNAFRGCLMAVAAVILAGSIGCDRDRGLCMECREALLAIYEFGEFAAKLQDELTAMHIHDVGAMNTSPDTAERIAELKSVIAQQRRWTLVVITHLPNDETYKELEELLINWCKQADALLQDPQAAEFPREVVLTYRG